MRVRQAALCLSTSLSRVQVSLNRWYLVGKASRGTATSLAVLGLAATVALVAPVQAQVSFITAPTYATGDSPRSIAVGDLDGDGDLDLATANNSGYFDNISTVSVLENNGNGTFATPQNFATENGAQSITLGDLDGDGDLDIATANVGGYPDFIDTVSVLKNNGNGTFTPPQNFAVGETPLSLTVGDLDGDGDLDLATANNYSDNVSMLKNNGNGTFAAPLNYAAGEDPLSITIGDLDGDDDLDLATANRGSYPDDISTVSVLKNNGNGTFAAPQTSTVEGRPYSITVGDLDRDGDLDLATANGYPSDNVSVLKNNGNGTFAAPQTFAIGDYPYSITVGDLDGDGDLDLATVNSSDSVSVLKNNGDGTFATIQNFTAGYDSRFTTIGDLNEDGNLDIITANRFSDNVSVLKNSGNGTFNAPQNFAVGELPLSITVGDLDKDGDLDLATANVGGYPDFIDTVSILKNNGNGTFAAAAPQNLTAEARPYSIAVGDLDSDGDLDLATTNSSGRSPDYIGTVSVLKNNGDGTFAAPQDFAIGGDRPRSITIGDLDRDGDLDIVTANSVSDNVSVLKNNGNGTFAVAQEFAAGDGSSSVTAGDLDGDGDLDLATANSGNVSVLKNNGKGTFAAPQNFAADGEVPGSITIGDLDLDGDLDLATTNRSDFTAYIYTVSVLKNNGNGTFATAQNFTVGSSPESITVGDLDGDGDLELVTGNSISYPEFINTVSVLKNNGNGTFAAPQDFAVGNDPQSITVGDLDRDGDLDLATANFQSDNVTVLQSTTPTLQLSPSPNRVTPTPLAGQSVSGNAYIFASGQDPDFLRVQFYLDDPDRSGEPIRLERSAPFDFAGGTNMDPTITQANPFDTTTLTNGEHTITATFARTDGTYRTITSTFTVGN